MNVSALRRCARCAFTLVELLVVVSVIALLLAILLPSLGSARRASRRTVCLANIRTLGLAQVTYAQVNGGSLIAAGEGSYDPQESWLTLLAAEGVTAAVRRCPVDASPHFDQPFTEFEPAVYRRTSYGINNYVSPTHAPLGARRMEKLTDIPRPSGTIQFVELAETGNYAVADHIHVQEFYSPLAPDSTPARAGRQMAIGRHGGLPADWTGEQVFGFVDGHVEPLTLKQAYQSPQINQFDPAVAH